jgi:hypothetical protein
MAGLDMALKWRELYWVENYSFSEINRRANLSAAELSAYWRKRRLLKAYKLLGIAKTKVGILVCTSFGAAIGSFVWKDEKSGRGVYFGIIIGELLGGVLMDGGAMI